MKASQIPTKEMKFIKKEAPKSIQEIEKNLWKNNITFTPRGHRDYLDISKEDFTKTTVNSIDGFDTNPSTFNIFRDSLKQTSAKLHEKLVMSLPDMHLDEISSANSGSDSGTDTEVVPLDFRTALIKAEEKIVIQAKPLHFKTADEDIQDMQRAKDLEEAGDEEYLSIVKKDAFDEDDEQVLMIDPGMDVEEIFGDVKLPCELVRRINNTLTAAELPDLPKQEKPKAKFGIVEPKTLAQVEKSFKYPVDKDAVPSPKHTSNKSINSEEVDNTPATEVVQYDL